MDSAYEPYINRLKKDYILIWFQFILGFSLLDLIRLKRNMQMLINPIGTINFNPVIAIKKIFTPKSDVTEVTIIVTPVST